MEDIWKGNTLFGRFVPREFKYVLEVYNEDAPAKGIQDGPVLPLVILDSRPFTPKLLGRQTLTPNNKCPGLTGNILVGVWQMAFLVQIRRAMDCN